MTGFPRPPRPGERKAKTSGQARRFPTRLSLDARMTRRPGWHWEKPRTANHPGRRSYDDPDPTQIGNVEGEKKTRQ